MLSLGWATADARWINSPGHWPTQSLLREVLWEPRLQQLLFRPLPELAQLRGEEAKLMQGEVASLALASFSELMSG